MSDHKKEKNGDSMHDSSPIKVVLSHMQLIDSGKVTDKKPLHRGQLFAKEKYFAKKNQEPGTPVKEPAKVTLPIFRFHSSLMI